MLLAEIYMWNGEEIELTPMLFKDTRSLVEYVVNYRRGGTYCFGRAWDIYCDMVSV